MALVVKNGNLSCVQYIPLTSSIVGENGNLNCA
jgi:hypothetical protein